LLLLPAGDATKKAWFQIPKRIPTHQQLETRITTEANIDPKVEEVQVDMAGMKAESRKVEL
jgi:hypothetical protein